VQRRRATEKTSQIESVQLIGQGDRNEKECGGFKLPERRDSREAFPGRSTNLEEREASLTGKSSTLGVESQPKLNRLIVNRPDAVTEQAECAIRMRVM